MKNPSPLLTCSVCNSITALHLILVSPLLSTHPQVTLSVSDGWIGEWIFPCRCMQGSITTTTDFLYGIDDCEPVQEGIYDYLPNLRKVPADQSQDNLELPPNNDIASKSNKTIMYHTLLGLPLKCCHNLILNSSLLQNRLPRSDFRITLRRIIISAHSGSCCYYVMVNIYSTPTVRYCLLCSVIRCYN